MHVLHQPMDYIPHGLFNCQNERFLTSMFDEGIGNILSFVAPYCCAVAEAQEMSDI